MNLIRSIKLIKNFTLITVIITIPLMGITSYYCNVKAQEPENAKILQVSPFIINVTLSPNEEYTYEIKVKNLLQTSLPLRVSKENFEAEDETGEYAFVEEAENSLLSWVEIDTTEFILEPQKEQLITLIVNTPQEIPFGGYHGMIFLEPVLPQNEDSASKLMTRVGVLMLANIGTSPDGTLPARITNFDIPDILFDNEETLNFSIQNISLYHFSAKPIVYVKPLFGDEMKLFTEEKFIFPGKTRVWQESAHFKNVQWPGVYTADLAVSIGQGYQTSISRKFIYFPIRIVILFLLASISIYFALFKRKNIKNMLRILIKG